MKNGFFWIKKQSIFLTACFIVVSMSPYARASNSSELLPRVTAEMNTAAYWIKRHPEPNRVILNPDQIRAFNESLVRKGLIQDMTAYPPPRIFSALSGELEKDWLKFKKGKYFDVQGKPAAASFYETLHTQMNLDAVEAGKTVRFALVVRRTNQRILPADDVLTAEPMDLLFDELQNTSLEPGTPVHVYHTSRDHAWAFTRSAASEGWVRVSDLAWTNRIAFNQYLKAKKMWVVTQPGARLYQDSGMKRAIAVLPMGHVLPLEDGSGKKSVSVRVPVRDGDGRARFEIAYMKTGDGQEGFAPLTAAAIEQHAFRMLGRTYDWGSKQGEQDCSAFIQRTFAVTGIRLPRNSSEQLRSGLELKRFSESATDAEKMRSFSTVRPAVTLIGLKGHIMLYLGSVRGVPYAIHAVYSYGLTEPRGGKKVVNRVIVSDLLLGDQSARGSLLRRTKSLVGVA